LGGAVHGDEVAIWVDDDGPGVAPEERYRIFDRFVRIEGGDRAQGSGLGLAIVKGFAEAMGMAVGVEQAPMGGARFILRMKGVA
jgi:two-component system sensor histidine kinase KdpD